MDPKLETYRRLNTTVLRLLRQPDAARNLGELLDLAEQLLERSKPARR
jgi:uncharacterized protein YjgD (DUF1641 family)